MIIDWKNLAMEFLRIAATAESNHPVDVIRKLQVRGDRIEEILAAYNELLKAEQFHQERWMFAIDPQQRIQVAPKGVKWSHRQWLEWTNGTDWAIIRDDWIRGFYSSVKDTLYFYKGKGFDECGNDMQWTTWQRLLTLMQPDVTGKTAVTSGMMPGYIGDLWIPRKVFGIVSRVGGFDKSESKV